MHNKIPKMKKNVFPNEIIWMVQCLYIVNLMNEEMNKQYSIHWDKNSLSFHEEISGINKLIKGFG